jgi:ribosomal protein S18 acetylase RimI-like enzyme
MSRALEICARSMFRHVMLCVACDNAAARSLYAGFGFRPIGQMVTYRRAAP